MFSFLQTIITVLIGVQPTIAQLGLIVPPDEVVQSYGGTESETTNCSFPFLYSNTAQFSCMMGAEQLWCAVVPDLSESYRWGFCKYKKCVLTANSMEFAGDTPTTTVSGRTCQNWALDTPHAHDFNDISHFPDDDHDGLQNKCRNPSNEPSIWCYTTDPEVRWEHCAIPPLCDSCEGRLNSGDNPVPESALSSSSLESYVGEVHSLGFSRLDSGGEDIMDTDGNIIVGAWCAAENDTEPWVQVSLDTPHKFIGVVTSGRADADDVVLEYKVLYSDDNATWVTVQNETNQDTIFYGSWVRDDQVPYMFDPPFHAQYVRIELIDWFYYPCMRFDFEACPDEPDCSSNICENGGTCVDMTDLFYCECPEGWTGAVCDEVVDLCESMPCQNGAVCETIGFQNYTCTCLPGYFGDDCEQGSLSSCLEVVLAGGVTSGEYTLDFGTTGPCEMSSVPQMAWDLMEMTNTAMYTDVTETECAQYCLDDPECKSVNYFVTVRHCFLRDFYAVNLITISATDGRTLLKACPGPKKVYCDLTNTSTPITVVSHNLATNYSGDMVWEDYDDRSHLLTYLPLLPEEIEIIKRESYTCSQHVDFYCFGSTGPDAKFFFNGELLPRELRSPLYAEDQCDCLLQDACTDTEDSCTCQYLYDDLWHRDGGDFTDKTLMPFQGLSIGYLTAYRKMYLNVHSMMCLQTTFEIDECSSDPCLNGGNCTEGNYVYNCTCPPGYSGQNCEININECASDPCLNDGVCADMLDTFMCLCPDGFEGDMCEIDVDECISDPCLNGGSCVDMADRYRCNCDVGWLGTSCDTEILECESDPCQNGGTCQEGIGGYNCTCIEGYEGPECQTDTDECASSPCVNGGLCSDDLGGYTCSCADGYTGDECQEDFDECSSAPCQNGATCLNNVNEYGCVCAPGFAGPACQINLNECESSPCEHGACRDEADGYECECEPGYTGDICETEIDECDSSPCENGRCVDVLDGFVCECDPGYSDDFCATDINECLSFPCLAGGTCHNNISRFECECPARLSGDRCELAMIDGQWSGWGQWSDCTVQCGNGVRTRVRECSNPPAQNGGTPCPGDMSQVDPCTELNCEHVDGIWGVWGEWGRCSVTCGPGTKTRVRVCNNPAPMGDGADCMGSAESTLPCQEWECGQALDGRFSLWGSWGACSASCGVGTMLRYRTCSDPPPVYGGDPCVGETIGASSCLVQSCPVYDDCLTWGDWSDCSAPCGDGIHRRQRTCRMQEDLRIEIEAARARAAQGAPDDEDELLPDWYWDIELSLEQHAIEGCQNQPCSVHQCITCSSEFMGMSDSLSCKGPKVSCSSEYPYCAYEFDPYASTPGMLKGCAAVGDCKNASAECENLKVQTLQSMMSFSESDVGELEPHPDTLLQAWATLGEKCTICCQNSLCNRNNLPTSDTLYNAATTINNTWHVIFLTLTMVAWAGLCH